MYSMLYLYIIKLGTVVAWCLAPVTDVLGVAAPTSVTSFRMGGHLGS